MKHIVGVIAVSVGLVTSGVAAYAVETEIQYLSGRGSDQTIEWQFKVNGGRNAAGQWSTIPVPSNWEFQGYGTYQYGSDFVPIAPSRWGGRLAPDSEGQYRYEFTVPDAWRNKRVRIVFDGVMTETNVYVNCKIAGREHVGGFYRFSYDITNLLNFSGQTNVLHVVVNRFSITSTSVNNAERSGDFWMLSGIHRPVWLEAFPQTYISRIAIDARHGGLAKVQATVEDAKSGDTVVAQVQTLAGVSVGSSFQTTLSSGDSEVTLERTLSDIDAWTAETPNLYHMHVAIKRSGTTVHEATERFGFRTVEVRAGDGLYINGTKIRIRGVNKSSFWPTTGRTTSRVLSLADANLMKDMNMNAVRAGHYSPNKHFLEVADELGLYVLDELLAWHARLATSVGERLIEELVVRDHNHPSIILWGNGNEGGWNTAHDDDFAIWDTQDRVVLHPQREYLNIYAPHYPRYSGTTEAAAQWDVTQVIMATELLHGMFDGGGGASLEDYWNKMRARTKSAGGFLWNFIDEGVVRDDRNGAIDVDGNHAPDGVLGPFRQKEGSFFAIKEIWAPFHVSQSSSQWLPDNFDGGFSVENRYEFTNLNTHSVEWELITMPGPGEISTGETIPESGSVTGPDVSPGSSGTLSITLPGGWQATHDALRLRIIDATSREIYTHSWALKRPAAIASRTIAGGSSTTVSQTDANDVITWTQGTRVIKIDKTTGYLQSVMDGTSNFQLRNGPRAVDGSSSLGSGPAAVTLGTANGGRTAKFTYGTAEPGLREISWSLMGNGWLKLEYEQRERGDDTKYALGATFSFPDHDTRIARVDWLGNGPYRVWKNRLKGVEYGLWGKAYNNTITGYSEWIYPEFKGYHSHLNWAVIDVKDAGSITVVTENDDLYLLLLKPPPPPPSENVSNHHTNGEFPGTKNDDIDIGFLHQIGPIGAKTMHPNLGGPMGLEYAIPTEGETFETVLYFYFGTLP